MSFFGKKRTKGQAPRQEDPLARMRALASIPVRNPEVAQEEKSEGLLLTYQVEVKPWFQGIFKRMSGKNSNIITKKLQLDGLGSSVWEMIDGMQSVQEITRTFAQTHQLESREAEISISGFLRDLGQRGLLAIKDVPEPPNG